MIVIILITITAPAMFALVPPLPAVSPAPLANLAEFTAPVICLPAVESVVHDSLVEFVLGVGAAPGAIVIMAGGTRHTRKHKHGRQGGSGQQFPCYSADARLAWHLHNTLTLQEHSGVEGLWKCGFTTLPEPVL